MPLLTNSRSRLLGGGRLAVPVPTLGSELLVNGDFETGDPPTGWSTASGATLDGIAEPRPGSAGVQAMYIARNTNESAAFKSAGATSSWILGSCWVKNVDATNIYIQLANTAGSSFSGNNNTTSWVQVFVVDRGNGGAPSVRLGVAGSAGKIGKFDDCSVKPMTLASMFSTRPYSTHATTKARATVTAGTRAGVVANLDSASNPQNFVIVSHDGVQTARMSKCVAGTYTEWSATVAYVAGAYVEVRRPAGGDIWQMFYNGSQVIADQTISDAAIKAATLHGMFNSYSGNTLTDFSCVPS